MPEFICRLGTVEGDVIERVYVSESADSLRHDLERKEFLIFAIRRKGGALGFLPSFGRKKIKMKDFLVFNQQLAALIQAGVNLRLGGRGIGVKLHRVTFDSHDRANVRREL